MPLKECPDCKKEVSVSANKCPHCGYELRNFYERNFKANFRSLEEANKKFTQVAYLLLLLAILMLIDLILFHGN